MTGKLNRRFFTLAMAALAVVTVSACSAASATPTAAPAAATDAPTAAATAVMCCRINPGFFRLARMFAMMKGLPVTNDRASDERRTCPHLRPENRRS